MKTVGHSHFARCAALVAFLITLGNQSTVAHTFTITEVLVLFRTNGTFQVDVRLDVDALVLGVSSSLGSAEIVQAVKAMSPEDLAAGIEAAKGVVAKRIRIRFDGKEAEAWVSFPEYDTPLARPEVPAQETISPPGSRPADPTLLGVTARLAGRIPEGAKIFTFGASRAMGPVKLTILDEQTVSGVKQLLAPSEDSPPYTFGERPAPFREAQPSADSRAAVWGRYVTFGFTRILPKGLDHVLFIIAMFLLSNKLRPLLWQVTAFTVAHTCTLALSILNVVSLPPRIVVPLIALSIAYVAVENVFTERLHAWRPALVFGFGLLHGLGFAAALRELGLPPGQFVESLLMFNVGVELGQLTVIALAFAAVGWARKKEWYRSAIVKPLSLAIGVVGMYWAIERGVYGV